VAEILRDNSYTVRSGVRRTPSAAIPAGSTTCSITLGRNNWPALGVRLSIFFTYDGTNYVEVRREFIAAGVIDPKTLTIPPAQIGFGWERNPQPLRALIETESPSQFNTSAVIEVG
jgi:hypothetical protein